MILPVSELEFKASIAGSSFIDIGRQGKFIILELSNNWHIVAHLRMSGRFTVTSTQPDPSTHNRLYLKLSGNKYLNFIDIRRFGTFHLIKDQHSYPGLQRLGADALDPVWTGARLFAVLQRHKKAVYSCLLDQSIISGVGNIYANEALFRSRLHPLKPAHTITQSQTEKLLHGVVNILSTSLAFKGTTLLDNSYKDTDGDPGKFRKLLKVYGRENEPCSVCGNAIKRIRVGNRSVFFCLECQSVC